MVDRTGDAASPVTDAEYQSILAFRTRLRRFLAWSAEQARAAGLTPTQHQLLVAIRGHAGPHRPTVGDLAGYLQLQHHSAVGLVDRAETAGLVRRDIDDHDHRVVRVALTPAGADVLEELTALHRGELEALAEGDWLPRVGPVRTEGESGG